MRERIMLRRRFTPLSLPGLRLWLDASVGPENAGGQPAADMDPVAAWRDRSGQGNDATQPTAARRPVYRTGVLSGRAAVRFDGIDDLLSLSAHLTETEGTVVAVCSDTSGGAGERTVLSGEALSLYAQVLPATTKDWGSYAGTDIVSGVDLGATHRLLTLVVRAPDDIDLVTDGALVTAVNGVAWPARPASAIGGDGSGVQVHAGDLCELLFYNRPLSTAERRRLERWLSRRYGIVLQA